MGSFSNQVSNFKAKTEKQLRVVMREAVQDTVELAQRTEAEAGRMRVDTGFLRASVQGKVHGMPTGPVRGRKGAKKNEYAGKIVGGAPVSVTLLGWDPNSKAKFYVGWTANYARLRESKDGFLRGAIEQWDNTVRNAARKY